MIIRLDEVLVEQLHQGRELILAFARIVERRGRMESVYRKAPSFSLHQWYSRNASDVAPYHELIGRNAQLSLAVSTQ